MTRFFALLLLVVTICGSVAAQDDNLVPVLSIERSTVVSGEPILVTLTVNNKGNKDAWIKPLTLSDTVDFLIKNPYGLYVKPSSVIACGWSYPSDVRVPAGSSVCLTEILQEKYSNLGYVGKYLVSGVWEGRKTNEVPLNVSAASASDLQVSNYISQQQARPNKTQNLWSIHGVTSSDSGVCRSIVSLYPTSVYAK